MRSISIGGLGGFELGFEAAGCAITPVAFVEPEKAAKAVLTKRWPGAVVYRDMGHLEEAVVNDRDGGRRSVDLVFGKFGAGDFPLVGTNQRVGCQPGRGQRALRLIRRIQPAAAIFELEAGLLTSDQGRNFGGLLALAAGWLPGIPVDGWRTFGALGPNPDLGDDGYGCQWRVLDLQYFAKAAISRVHCFRQCRSRVYLVLQRGIAPLSEVLLDAEDFRRFPEEVGGANGYEEEWREGDLRGPPDAGLAAGYEDQWLIPFVWRVGGFMKSPIEARATLPTISGDNVALADRQALAVRRLTPEEVELAFTYESGFTAAGVKRTVRGVKDVAVRDTPRYRMLGRYAVPPAIVEWIAGRLIPTLNITN